MQNRFFSAEQMALMWIHVNDRAINFMDESLPQTGTLQQYLSAIPVPKFGTITWFEITKDGLPTAIDHKTDLGDYTKNVLITDGKLFHVTQYVYMLDGTPAGWYGYNNIPFTPTHWAYINYP